MKAYVFTGPTLSPDEARMECDVECLPPVAQGDVYRAAIQRPQAIGIIDGYFERVPSVWHKEILWAMTQSIYVFGSASMGALRAAELAAFGMEGVGKIFNAYADGTLEDDDEVAVLHAPAEFGYRCFSEAMVNIRATVAAAEAAAVIRQSTGTLITRVAKELYYADRTYPRILELAAVDDKELPHDELESFGKWWPVGKVDQKREDALAMLRCMRDRLRADLEPKRLHFTLEETKYWKSAMRETQAPASIPFEAGATNTDIRPLLRNLLKGSRSSPV